MPLSDAQKAPPRRNPAWLKFCSLILAQFLFFPKANAGILFSAATGWDVFAFSPKDSEKTPNYYGVVGNFALGYSVNQIFDLTAFSRYAPGRRAAARIGKEDTSLIYYGCELGLRIQPGVIFQLRNGHGVYRSFNGYFDEEVTGRWRGPGGGFSIGGFTQTGQNSFTQTSLNFDQIIADRDNIGVRDKRRINKVGVSITFVYNDLRKDILSSNLFRGF